MNRTRVRKLAERAGVAGANTTVIMAAAQHPLEEGVRPGREFTRRLEAAHQAGELIVANGGNVEYAVAGHRHRDVGKDGIVHVDKVALYDAAARWYVEEKGVDPAKIRGPDWGPDKPFLGWDPNVNIYNGADELDFLAQVVARSPHCKSGTYFCSPGQARRAERYANNSLLMGHVEVPEGWVRSPDDFHASRVTEALLVGLSYADSAGYTDFGLRLLRWKSQRDRMPSPDQGGPETLPELQQEYAALGLTWYKESPPPQEAGSAFPAPAPA